MSFLPAVRAFELTPELDRQFAQLVESLKQQGLSDQTLALTGALIAGIKKEYGADSLKAIEYQLDLVQVYIKAGRLDEAERIYQSLIPIIERRVDLTGTLMARALLGLAELQLELGRPRNTIALVARAQEVEKKSGAGSHLSDEFKLLGRAESALGQHDAAIEHFKRSINVDEMRGGPDSSDLVPGLRLLANTYLDAGRSGDAELALRRALAIQQKTSGDTRDIVLPLTTLLINAKRRDEALEFVKGQLARDEAQFGKNDPRLVQVLLSLATIYMDGDQFAVAEQYAQRAVNISKSARFVSDLPRMLLAGLLYLQHKYEGAFENLYDVLSTTMRKRQQNGHYDDALQSTRSRRADLDTNWDWMFRAAAGIAPQNAERLQVFERTFLAAQLYGESEAAAALTKMAARQSKGAGPLARLVREQQDLAAELAPIAEQLLTLPLERASTSAKYGEVSRQTERDGQIRRRLAEIDRELSDKYKDYYELVSPRPVESNEVRGLLAADEALVVHLQVREHSYVWVVTREGERWAPVPKDSAALSELVHSLRCGLDGAWALSGSACPAVRKAGAGALAPFDLASAHELYAALFGQVEDLIKGKQLLIVASGPLAQMPFQVLVTQPPAGSNYRTAAWLIREHALTVLPAVSSLKALRRLGRQSGATKPMLGFGNPLLDGDPSSPIERRSAQRARDLKTCPAATAPQAAASLSQPHRGITPVALRSGHADVAFLRAQPPLPETADELCAVARDVHADPGAIRLGARATEREVKRLSESGELAQYRIVHFATHGALAGEITGNSEPGLLLTPPSIPSEEDDGYLSASEIAGLRLDADWVILSACNTAAAGAQGTEALSGLARAFIYAQARALLVSHWAVDSDATVKLITGAMSRLAADKQIGRAEAMRQSMLAMIDHGRPEQADPAFWAPFVVVGEGAR